MFNFLSSGVDEKNSDTLVKDRIPQRNDMKHLISKFKFRSRKLKRWLESVNWGTTLAAKSQVTAKKNAVVIQFRARTYQSDRTSVLKLAIQLEPDASLAVDWFLTTPLHELGGCTAEQIVIQGDAEKVIAMLQAIKNRSRDWVSLKPIGSATTKAYFLGSWL